MTSPTPEGPRVAGSEYDKLHGFFLEAVGLAALAADDFLKPYLDDLLRRARYEIEHYQEPIAQLEAKISELRICLDWYVEHDDSDDPEHVAPNHPYAVWRAKAVKALGQASLVPLPAPPTTSGREGERG